MAARASPSPSPSASSSPSSSPSPSPSPAVSPSPSPAVSPSPTPSPTPEPKKPCCACFHGDEQRHIDDCNTWKALKEQEGSCSEIIVANIKDAGSQQYCDCPELEIKVRDHNNAAGVGRPFDLAMAAIGQGCTDCTVNDTGCSTFDNLEAAQAKATELQASCSPGTTIKLTGNQNISTTTECHQTPYTFYVCSVGVGESAGNCKTTGDSCWFDNDQSNDSKCRGRGGPDLTQRCLLKEGCSGDTLADYAAGANCAPNGTWEAPHWESSASCEP